MKNEDMGKRKVVGLRAHYWVRGEEGIGLLASHVSGEATRSVRPREGFEVFLNPWGIGMGLVEVYAQFHLDHGFGLQDQGS
uniref:Uncharacterized protein n=1 Tax=Cannabis sativa TaxID=3483 RepID=A0A803QRJ0_CANSA